VKVNKFVFVLISIVIILLTSCAQNVKVSEEMKGFMALIDATNSMDDAAKPFGYSAEEMPLGYYEIKSPTITASSEEKGIVCYNVNLKHGFIESNVQVCWSENKILSIIEIE
jgi:hypothetical protein